ncbi:thioesterase II family protein [Paenibacillus peoriae]|uniref:Alpha/beta hydrolase n=1 Tax=Paenibacillus peoriae TaxID=59893 RepID=A0A7H0Y780_9BACL|nr:thioesterase domain-containing protein [Paenibacillus peoriae]QNR66938.1 alpha/beta hydrolase [Paenibacillus peoriae]
MSAEMLLCLPYAGGSLHIYNKWKRHGGHEIKIIGMEYSGRGKRFNEQLYKNFDEAIHDIYVSIKQSILLNNSDSYYIFGHSLGGIMAFELVRRYVDICPKHVFISAAAAPHPTKSR